MNKLVGWGATRWPSGLTFDDQDLVSTILLFGNVEAQKLAWRRRDPVELAPTR
jgi:hypothetical protein